MGPRGWVPQVHPSLRLVPWEQGNTSPLRDPSWPGLQVLVLYCLLRIFPGAHMSAQMGSPGPQQLHRLPSYCTCEPSHPSNSTQLLFGQVIRRTKDPLLSMGRTPGSTSLSRIPLAPGNSYTIIARFTQATVLAVWIPLPQQL